MDHDFIEQLENQGLLDADTVEKLHQHKSVGIISLRPEIMSILYLGVLLLSSGLGILLYKNIDSIGHTTLLFLIAILSILGYSYCWRKKPAFSWEKTYSENHFFDYTLLLSTLLTSSFFGYMQFQYKVFGDHWDLATLIPMLVLFFTAYYFDHLGVLSLAITHLAAWAGLTITPLKILQSGNFSSEKLILTGIALGVLLNLLSRVSQWKKWKAHFYFTYLNFGFHLLMVCLLAEMFNNNNTYLIWLLLIFGVAYYFYQLSIHQKSFYLILCLSLYVYVAVLFCTAKLLGSFSSTIFLLFFGISIALIFFLIEMNKKIKSK